MALPGGLAFRDVMNAIDDCQAQVDAVGGYFDQLADRHARLPLAANDEPALAADPPTPTALAALAA